MKFEYKTQEQLEADRPKLKQGEASFEIKKASEKVSKNGNDMIELLVQVWDADGTTASIFDYLLPQAAYKIKALCDSVGKPDWYGENAELSAIDLIGEGGKCFLKMQKSKDPQYADRMQIGYYIKHELSTAEATHDFMKKEDDTKSTVTKPLQNNDGFDDDLPF